MLLCQSHKTHDKTSPPLGAPTKAPRAQTNMHTNVASFTLSPSKEKTTAESDLQWYLRSLMGNWNVGRGPGIPRGTSFGRGQPGGLCPVGTPTSGPTPPPGAQSLFPALAEADSAMWSPWQVFGNKNAAQLSGLGSNSPPPVTQATGGQLNSPYLSVMIRPFQKEALKIRGVGTCKSSWCHTQGRVNAQENSREGGILPEAISPGGKSNYPDILWPEELQPCPQTVCVPISPRRPGCLGHVTWFQNEPCEICPRS